MEVSELAAEGRRRILTDLLLSVMPCASLYTGAHKCKTLLLFVLIQKPNGD
jgi:hypothetical protein